MKRVPKVRRFELSGESPEKEICYAITKEEKEIFEFENCMVFLCILIVL